MKPEVQGGRPRRSKLPFPAETGHRTTGRVFQAHRHPSRMTDVCRSAGAALSYLLLTMSRPAAPLLASVSGA